MVHQFVRFFQAIQRRENEQQRKHPRVPQDLPRVPAPLPTKQKRSRRMPRTRSTDLFHKWLGITGGEFDPNLHPLHVNNLNISKTLATNSRYPSLNQFLIFIFVKCYA